MVRIQGVEVCDLVYAATNPQYERCKLMSLGFQYLLLQLAQVQ